MRSTTAILSTAFLLGACDDGKDISEPTRHAIGKADKAGSCAVDDCGGQAADGNCFCDTDCVEWGDCCDNVEPVCKAPPQACDDGTARSLLCDTPPVCAAGLVTAVQKGCPRCVDPESCAAPGAECDDESTHSPYCDTPPVCAEGLLKALQRGSFACVDPQTCAAPY